MREIQPIMLLGIVIFQVAALAQELPSNIAASINSEGDELTISWTSQSPNDAYIIETRDNLNSDAAHWETSPNIDGWPTQATDFSVNLKQTEKSRFFRIVSIEEDPIERGRIIDSNYMGFYTIETQTVILKGWGIYPAIIPQSIIDVYNLTYETVAVNDLKTIATGVVAIPRSGPVSLPILSYQHGTIIAKDHAPSGALKSEYYIPLACASAGFVGVAPDYLGMGGGAGIHPYLHAKSEATAVIDMIRATKNLLSQLNISDNGQLFLMGYSQGGHATMAAHRQLQQWHQNELQVTASAPMSGPYHLSHTVFQIIENEHYPVPANYAYLIHAYQQIYGLADDWSAIIKAPYDDMVPVLFDGYHDDDLVYNQFPTQISNFFDDNYLADFMESPNSHYLYQKLVENDLINWAPDVPVRLYHTLGDTVVSYDNAQAAYSAFINLGAQDVSIVDVGQNLDHGESAPPSLVSALLWFSSF